MPKQHDYWSWGTSELIERIQKLELEAKKKSITVYFSDQDLEDLMSGEEFDWTFEGVDVHLIKADEPE